MRKLFVMKSGRKYVGNDLALILPAEEIVESEHKIDHLSDDDYQKVLVNPNRYNIDSKEVK